MSSGLRTIVTHSGRFHADESLAVALLRRLPQFREHKVVRTRDPALVASGDVVVDVGGVYDPTRGRFDHHQASFQDTFDCEHHNSTRLSSAGLIYKHYGQDVIRQYLQHHRTKPADSDDVDDEDTDDKSVATKLLWLKLYERFIEPFDAVDNGVERYTKESTLEPLYQKPYDVFDMVSDLNAEWNDPTETDEATTMQRFEQAVDLVGRCFERQLQYLATSWLPARTLVEAAFLSWCLGADAQGDGGDRCMVFEETACPWKEHVFEVERQHGKEGHLLYVLYPEKAIAISGPTDKVSWRVHAVPSRLGTFHLRKPMPRSWRGLRDAELSQVAGIADCTFVHANGFIGGNATRSGALQMARRCIANDSDL
jgi:uncharacterized UPF0160 family protein